jgi:hypothetical protein
MAKLIDPNAVEKIKAAKLKLQAGSWGGTETVCMMSALVKGAECVSDCVTAGWPDWLVKMNVILFDASVGVDDEKAARYEFALAVARAVQDPRDYDKARDLFLIARLDTGEHSALKSLKKLYGDWTRQRETVERVVALLRRRIAGDDVVAEMKEAYAAAYAAGDAADGSYAADAAAYAAYAAADAARAAADGSYAAYAAAYAAADGAYAADAAADGAYAADAARAAAYAAADAARAAADGSYAAYAAAYAAGDAADAATRNDLIAALQGA